MVISAKPIRKRHRLRVVLGSSAASPASPACSSQLEGMSISSTDPAMPTTRLKSSSVWSSNCRVRNLTHSAEKSDRTPAPTKSRSTSRGGRGDRLLDGKTVEVHEEDPEADGEADHASLCAARGRRHIVRRNRSRVVADFASEAQARYQRHDQGHEQYEESRRIVHVNVDAKD
eukprot:scaffold7381_cov310-Pinguiococcus_pyrenoidosus.AAC.41